MTPEKQQIAIAEACGWTDLNIMGQKGIEENLYGRHPTRRGSSIAPDYTEDLNAMHEAEKVLTDEQDLEYSEALEQVVEGRFMANNAEDMRRLRSATAAQRAEAFLRTIGKWEGE